MFKSFLKLLKNRIYKNGEAPKLSFLIISILPSFLITLLFAIVRIYGEGFSKNQSNVMICALLLSYFVTVIKVLDFKIVRYITSTLFLIVSPFAMFYFVELFMHDPYGASPMKEHIVKLNVAFYYLFLLLLITLTTRTDAAVTITTLIPTALGIANYMSMATRDLPIYPWDIFSAKTAMSVVDNYVIKFTPSFYFSIFCLLTIVILSFPLNFRFKFKKIWIGIFPAVASVLLFSSYIGHINTIFRTESNAAKEGFYPYLFSASYLYKYNGTPVSFIYTLKFLKLAPPDNYSVSDLKELYNEYKEKAEADYEEKNKNKMPNVIVIMNEAFSDPGILGDFETNIEYLPFINSLKESGQAIFGDVMVSVKGGNTPNSEFEFLTGTSMAFLPSGSIPYQQYIDGKTQSMVSQLDSLGYYTVGMHNYYASGWERDEVYKDLGFDKIMFNSDFKYQSKIRGYISDLSMFKEIMDLQRNKEEGEPLFVFGVTMQNHGDYPDSKNGNLFFPDVKVENNNYAYVSYLNNYLSLLKVTDRAFERLVSFYEKIDEPTVIIMFGDHQPNDHVVYPILKANGIDIAASSLEVQQSRYKTPYIIWSNYEMDGSKISNETSLNYLGGQLLDAAGVPLTPFQMYLKDLIKTHPMLNAFCYLDEDWNYHSIADIKTQKALNEYNRIQYNMIFDRKHTVKQLFEVAKPA